MEIESLFSAAVHMGLPVVLWRLPGDDKTQLITELSETIATRKIAFEGKHSGFAVSPFVDPMCNKTLFIDRDLSWDSSSDKISEGIEIEGNPEKQKIKEMFIQRVNRKNPPQADIPSSWHNNAVAPTVQSGKEPYCRLVADGILSIKNRRFEKVVLSHTRVVSLPDDFNIIQMFKKACTEYPKTFCYLLSIPKVGTWMGATPEILLSLNNDKILYTMALGGTRVIDPEKDFDRSWGKKEIEEHTFISQFVAACFKKVGVDTVDSKGPFTINAGTISHLKTDFFCNLEKFQSTQIAGNLLALLHPTPAVCGLPKETAASYIAEKEGYDREFYTGFLGPVNINNESHLYVNLRCMQLYKHQAILYVGAGVTGDSDPEKEWEETQNKSNTLLKVISLQA